MKQNSNELAKISFPKVSCVVMRERLFNLIDTCNRPITWVCAPAGAGKTTLTASYITSKKIPCLWYQLDETDSDIASFFYYMGRAIKNIFPEQKTLPFLTPEYLPNIPVFTKRYFENLYELISSKKPRNKKFTLIFDNFQDVAAGNEFHHIINNGLYLIPPGINTIFISRAEPSPVFARLQASEKINYTGISS